MEATSVLFFIMGTSVGLVLGSVLSGYIWPELEVAKRRIGELEYQLATALHDRNGLLEKYDAEKSKVEDIADQLVRLGNSHRFGTAERP